MEFTLGLQPPKTPTRLSLSSPLQPEPAPSPGRLGAHISRNLSHPGLVTVAQRDSPRLMRLEHEQIRSGRFCFSSLSISLPGIMSSSHPDPSTPTGFSIPWGRQQLCQTSENAPWIPHRYSYRAPQHEITAKFVLFCFVLGFFCLSVT